jgi:hypothetical protein
MSATYKIVRKYLRQDVESQEIDSGLSLEEAQEHCSDPETSYKTGTHREGLNRTEEFGPWFDCYYEE